MRIIRFAAVPVLAVAWILYAGGSVMTAQNHDAHHHEMKAGKNGTITFSKALKVGDETLPPGQYRIQHRVDGEQHFVHFRSTETKKQFEDVLCKLEQLDEKAKNTAAYLTADGRVTKVIVRGEDVAHVLED